MADVITRFRLETTQYDSALRNESQRLADFAKKASAAGNEFGKFTQKNVEAARAMGQIGTSATNSKDKVKELVGSFNDLAKAYNQLTKDQQQSDFGKAMAESLLTLKGRITEAKQELYGLDAAAKQLKTSGGGFDKLLGGIAGQFGMSASMFTGVGAAVAGAGTAFKLIQDNVQTAMGFEKSMSALSALTGMVGQDLDRLKEYSIELGSTTTLTASQVADAFRLIGSQQPQLLSSGEALKEVTKYAITLSEAAGIDLATASQTLSTSINQMGGDSANAARYVNVLAAASQKGAGDISWLGEAIVKSGTYAKAVGTGYEELVANLETLAKAGYDASTAGTALRSIILELEKQNDDQLKPSVVGLTTAFENLSKKQLDISGYADLVNARFAAQTLTLAENAAQTRVMTEAITGTNIAEEQATTNVGNLSGAIKQLESAWEGLNLHINDSNGPLTTFVNDLATTVRQVDVVAQKIKDLAGEIPALGTLGKVLSIYGKYMGFVINPGATAGKFALDMFVDDPAKQNTTPYDRSSAQNPLKGVVDKFRSGKPEDYKPVDLKALNELAALEDEATGATKSIKTLQDELKKLKKLRDDAANAGDINKRDELNLAIKAKEADIRVARGTTTTPSAKQTPETKAADIVKSAQEAYAQTMVEARLRMEAGMDDTLAYKKKELDAQQRMFEAYGKAYAVYASPEYKEAYDQATDQYKRMASELAKSTEEQKIVTENAKALEAAQKKLAEEERKVAEAAAAGKYISKRAVNNARKEVERLTQIVDVKAGKVELPDIPKEVTVKVSADAKALEDAKKTLADAQQKLKEAEATGNQQNIYVSKRAVNNARKEVERLTQIVDVKAGKVELPDIPKEVTVKVSADAKALEDAKKTLADAQQKLKEAEATGNQQNIYVSKRAVNNARKEVERLTQIVDVKAGKVELPDIPKEVEQVINTKVGEVLTPDIAAEIVQTISTQLGDIITPEIADQLTQTINTKVGEVITPDIATELTQVVNVVAGNVELPDIPKEVEQVINTKVGEVITPDVATEIVQTISTQLGDIITPEIADQLTQTINTKVGEVVTPDIATELTQVVNVVTGDVDLPDIPKEKEVKVKFTQENLQALTSDLKTQQQQAVVGSMDYTQIAEQIADANALKNVMQTALQEGLDNVIIDSQKLFDQLLAGNIPDSVWENIVEQMNAGMKDRKSGKQYEFNAQTGDVKETKTATANESVVGLMQKTAGGIGSIASGIEGLGAEIPEGFKDVIGGINSAMTIMQGIASILAIIETLNEAQSIGSFIPFFKNGGKVPHAATGLVVPGNDHSDHTLIAASSGEVILNRAQQSNLINDLDGAGRNVTVRGVIDGTTIRLVLDNTSRQMGKGTYVTSR